MSNFFNKTLDDLLKVKGISIVQYFEDLSATQRKNFFNSHIEIFRIAKYFKKFIEDDRFDLIRPYVEEKPSKFTKFLLKYDLKIGIPTVRSPYWSQTERKRVLSSFHYSYPELVVFRNGADIRAWLRNAPKDISFSSMRYVLKEIAPQHAANPAMAFGSMVRSTLQAHHVEELTSDDFDILLSDGDTLLNELFNHTMFKEYIKEDIYPSDDFVNTLELNCTMAAMTKDRSSRHGKRVARNLKRAKVLLEIKNVIT